MMDNKCDEMKVSKPTLHQQHDQKYVHGHEQQQSCICPCVEFQSIQSISDAIINNTVTTSIDDIARSKPLSSASEDISTTKTTSFQRLIVWICSSAVQYNDNNNNNNNLPKHSCRYCNENRVNTSIRILNAIRNTVRPYLQQQQQRSSNYTDNDYLSKNDDTRATVSISAVENENSPVSSMKPVRASFHQQHQQIQRNHRNDRSLTSSSSSTTTKLNSKHTKRRIRPVMVTQSEQYKTSTMGNLINLSNSEFPSLLPSTTTTEHHNLTTENNVWSRPISKTNNSKVLPDTDGIPVLSKQSTANIITTPKKSLNTLPKIDAVDVTSPVTDTATIVIPCKMNANPTRVKIESVEEISHCSSIKSMIALYTSLIQHCLVPSTILEIQLLLRLLTVSSDQYEYATSSSTDDKYTNDTSETNNFASILCSSARCLYFAVSVLRDQALLLQGLGIGIVQKLIRCTPFIRHLPDVTEQMIRYVQKFDTLTSINVNTIIGNQTVHLTLPFKSDRDSRNNFRTREEQAIYKNREECRDAFLYQLRAFIQLKGSMTDSSEANRVLSKIRHTSKTIISNLFHTNVSWFAEVFVEMIVQIGHVTLQGTDAETEQLLLAVDKEKLQKLHQRFSSKSTPITSDRMHTSTIVVDDKRDANIPPFVAAQQYFTGYQEFFFVFIMSADSYKFSVHLRSTIITMLKELNQSKNTYSQMTDKDILDARLLARFLGLLLFSPNWLSTSERRVKQGFVITVDELSQIAAADLSILHYVTEKLKHDNILLTISWIVELLKMGKWNPSLIKSSIYCETISMLRLIQMKLSIAMIASNDVSESDVLVRNLLESFFYESVGLGCAVTLDVEATNRFNGLLNKTNTKRLGTPDLGLVLVPHLDELLSLITFLSQSEKQSFRSPGATKKLRPSILNASIVHTPFTFPINLSSQAVLPPSFDNSTYISPSSVPNQVNSKLLSKLHNQFFHQHGELKIICDFVAINMIKNLNTQLKQQCIVPLLYSNTPCQNIERHQMIHALKNACIQFLTTDWVKQICAAITTLSPTGLSQDVIGIAVELMTNTLKQHGVEMVSSIVDDAANSVLHPLGFNQSKRLFSKESSENDIEQLDLYSALSLAIKDLAVKIDKLEGDVAVVSTSMNSLSILLDQMSHYDSRHAQDDHSLRQLYSSILHLDDASGILLIWALDETKGQKEQRWKILVAFIEIILMTQKISHRGLRSAIISLADQKFLIQLIRLGADVEKVDSLSKTLRNLVDEKMILPSQLNVAIQESGSITSLSAHILEDINSSWSSNLATTI